MSLEQAGRSSDEVRGALSGQKRDIHILAGRGKPLVRDGFGYHFVLASQVHHNGLSMKIVSGGQSGVDQAALDAAIVLGMFYGGWVPKGGLAENFPHAPGLLKRYPEMVETETSDPAERTKLNVRDSDATIILVRTIEQTKLPGTTLAIETANRLGRPYLIQVVDQPHAAVQLSQWLSDRSREKAIHTLNIAGPRNSEAPEFYDQAKALLETALPLFSSAANAARRGK